LWLWSLSQDTVCSDGGGLSCQGQDENENQRQNLFSLEHRGILWTSVSKMRCEARTRGYILSLWFPCWFPWRSRFWRVLTCHVEHSQGWPLYTESSNLLWTFTEGSLLHKHNVFQK
jgi:hypothetical protein